MVRQGELPKSGPVRLKFMAYVDLVRIEEGRRADDSLRISVQGKTELEAARNAYDQLATHIKHLEAK